MLKTKTKYKMHNTQEPLCLQTIQFRFAHKTVDSKIYNCSSFFVT